MKRLFLLLSALFLISCGSEVETSSTATAYELSLIEGANSVEVDRSFKNTFSKTVNQSTVLTSSFFIVLTPSASSNISKATFNETTCNVNNAIEATVSCDNTVVCSVTPTSNLYYSTSYTACLTTGITYADGDSFDGAMYQFTTDATDEIVIRDTKGDAIEETGTTGVYPSTINVTFTEAMDDDSVTTDDNITLSCQSGSDTPLTPSISVAAAGATNTYTISVTDAYKYAKMACDLTLTNGVTDLGGTAISETTYEFTNACALNDHFNADTQTCWGNIFTNSTWDTWSELTSNLVTFNADQSSMDLSYASTSNVVVFKTVSVDTTYTITAYFDDVENLGNGDFVGVMLNGNTNISSLGKYVKLGVYKENNDLKCAVFYSSGTGEQSAIHSCSIYSDYYIKINGAASTFGMQYSGDGASWSDFSASDKTSGTFPSSASDFLNGLTSTYLSIIYTHSSGSTTTAELDSVYVTGMSTTGQY